ncbi:MAG TPA: penicillin-binding protein 2 [Verrucomicrobiae bacterium]|nr:penicillin-binding protein 2 [Verrucomicrobiae bacterium]
MSSYAALKNLHAERQAFFTRVAFAVFVCSGLALVLSARLVHLQVVEHDYYTTRSDENRMRLTVIPPVRGLIYDRGGTLLAQNAPGFVLEIVREEVADMDATLARLGQLVNLTEADRTRFRERLRKTPKYRGVPLRTNLSMEEVARFQLNRYEFKGVDINAGLTRNYPLGKSASHVVGYIGGITEDHIKALGEHEKDYRGTQYIGIAGAEKSHEDTLHGTLSTKIVETNAGGRPLRELDTRRGAPGLNLFLSVDARLQQVAETAFGARNGALVAIEPQTGEVLVLLSKPGFDPHLFVDGIDVPTYKTLQEDPGHPLFNRALQGTYSPGSTIKPLMALAALETNSKNPAEREFCTGEFTLQGSSRKYRCWERKGHGWLDMEGAVAHSCDVYFYQLALTLGIDRISSFLSAFGVGVPTGLDLPGEKAGLLPSREWKKRVRRETWYPGETVNVGIGQGYWTMTPVQLAQVTARMAMRGGGFKPHIVHAQQDVVSGTVTAVKPESLPRMKIRDENDWHPIVKAMETVAHVPGGTAYRAMGNAPYRVAAKTGTVQVAALAQDDLVAVKQDLLPEHLRDHALFVAFAPAEAPRIALAVLVEHAGGGGGAIAAPIARQVMDAWLLPQQSALEPRGPPP